MEFSILSISEKKPMFIVAEKAMDELCHSRGKQDGKGRKLTLFDHKRRLGVIRYKGSDRNCNESIFLLLICIVIELTF